MKSSLYRQHFTSRNDVPVCIEQLAIARGMSMAARRSIGCMHRLISVRRLHRSAPLAAAKALKRFNGIVLTFVSSLAVGLARCRSKNASSHVTKTSDYSIIRRGIKAAGLENNPLHDLGRGARCRNSESHQERHPPNTTYKSWSGEGKGGSGRGKRRGRREEEEVEYGGA